MRTSARLAVAAAYLAIFWLGLPLLLWFIARDLDRRLGWVAAPHGVGWIVIGLGAALVIWAIGELARGGRGLPIMALPPPRFTRRGPYRHARHPIYLGFNGVVFGAGLAWGSPSLAWIVAPLLLPAWLGYARLEERALVRRFGAAYLRYGTQVGFLPRFGLYRLSQLAMWLRLLPATVEGRSHVPRRGPAILVHNHASYLDPAFVGVVTRRPVHFLTTAEAYRSGFKRWLIRRFVNLPVRRYRPDPIACREMLRLLADGEVVGVSAEGERTPDGAYQGALPGVASVLSRIPVPTIPVGISGAYDTGPRWSDVVRRRPVSIAVGRPIRWEEGDPARLLDEALLRLIETDPQPVHLDGLPREKIARVLWRCPECADDARWFPAELRCGACGAEYRPTPDGRLRDPSGRGATLAELGVAVRAHPEKPPLRAHAGAYREPTMYGPIRPLQPLGEGTLEIDPQLLRWERLHVPLATIRSTTTERADTLQIATTQEMWQFRLRDASAFRFRLAVERWRGAGERTARRYRRSED